MLDEIRQLWKNTSLAEPVQAKLALEAEANREVVKTHLS